MGGIDDVWEFFSWVYLTLPRLQSLAAFWPRADRIGQDFWFRLAWVFRPFLKFQNPTFLMRVAGFNIWVAAAIVGREESTPPRAAGTDTMGD